MKNYRTIPIILSILIFISGCRSDNETFTIEDENLFPSTLKGLVVDQYQNPMAGAMVDFNGVSTLTDEYGFYRIGDVKVGNQHNSISVTKAGYFDGCRSFRTDKSATLVHKTQLIKMNFNHSFASSSGLKISEGDVELNFPINAIMYAASETPYNGEVRVAIQHIDPVDRNSSMQMPGDLSAMDENNEIILLRSYGMVYVEMQTPTGEKLQISEGNTVSMAVEIPMELKGDAPMEIPMWHFNHGSGLWENEGVATKEGDKYVAQVSHFSIWNYDDREESIILSGRVIDQDGNPLTSAHILISADDAKWGGHGPTNADGTFSGRVTKGKVLNVSLLGSCRGEQLPIAQVGPFDTDARIEDIMVSMNDLSQNRLLVKGAFVNCEGEQLTEGVIQVNGMSIILIDGKLNVTIPYCTAKPTSITLVAFDRATLKDKRSSVNVTSDIVDLGTVIVCDDEEDYIEVKCQALNLNKLLTYQIGMTGLGAGGARLDGYKAGTTTHFSLEFNSSTMTEGTFQINNGSFTIFENNGEPGYPRKYTSSLSPSEITITDNKEKSRWEGFYTVTRAKVGTSEFETFTGTFRKKY